MTFSLRRRGEFTVATRTMQREALERIGAGLEKERATRVRIDADSLYFGVGFFRTHRWSILAAIDGGSITVRPVSSGPQVRYSLSFRRLTLLATLLIAAVFVPTVLLDRTPASDAMLFLAFCWLWLVGGNFALASVRFPSWLKKRLRQQ